MPMISKSREARLKKRGIEKKLPTLKKEENILSINPGIDLSQSSDAMKAAIRAADAAVKTAQIANGLMKESISNNQKIVLAINTAMSNNQATKLKVNRDSNNLISNIDIIRE